MGGHRTVSRRTVLRTAGMAGVAWFATGYSAAEAGEVHASSDDPFALGVASGDPRPDGVVLWTRLAPQPLALDGRGGMPSSKVQVRWEVADDARFRKVVKRGTTFAVPELGHSLHVEVDGLRSGREYHYRFRTGDFVSRTGTTKTAPKPGTKLARVSLGVVSCQAWWAGFYPALDHLADDAVDVAVHLGDYIYEGAIPADGLHRKVELPAEIRAVPWELHQYRLRHALFHTDADLQRAHAAAPFVVTWDDHDIVDNWAADHQPGGVWPERFRRRRAAAAQAYYEHLPLRLPQRPDGPDIKLYRRITYGDLVTLHVLDCRMYRDVQACGDDIQDGCEERLDPGRTMLGFQQERWLYDGLASAATSWNLIANQVPMAQMDLDPGKPMPLFMDPWDGYKPARDRLFEAIAGSDVPDTVVLSGDRHRHYAANLKADFEDPDSPTLAVEFGATSISSGQDGTDADEHADAVLASNEHVEFMVQRRGYLRMTAEPDVCRADHLVTPYVTRPGAPIAPVASYVTEAGNPGLQPDGP